ncbi:MAG: dipeptidase PepE [Acidobacteriales bacterium]|nr:dipeptidase PepE [Terriglobales bacterium]
MTSQAAHRILLLSNSTMHGQGYLDHAEAEIRAVLGRARHVLFVPFALHDRAGYSERASARLGKMGYRVHTADQASGRCSSVDEVDAVFIGGGNTFRLLKTLYDYNLLAPLRKLVAGGCPYIGSSAGSIVAGPSIKTTKDMPIVEPPSFRALGIVNFQVSPHYLDPDPNSTHMGETQEERIQQFFEENDCPVVGLREGTMLRVDGNSVTLKGNLTARVFLRGQAPVECPPGSDLVPCLEPMAVASERAE